MGTNLVDLFQQRSDAFAAGLAGNPSPEVVVTTATELLKRLFDDYAKGRQLGLLQRRILPFVRDLAVAAVGSLPAVVVVPAEPLPVDRPRRWRLADRERWVDSALQGMPVIVVVLAVLFSDDLVVILLALVWLLSTLLLGMRKRGPESTKVVPAPMTVDSGCMLDSLRTIVYDAERMLQQAGDLDDHQTKGDTGFWSEHGDLLDLLHDLSEILTTGDVDYAMKKIRVVPTLLKSKGLDLVDYDGSNERWFDCFPSTDVDFQGSKTSRPALLHGEQLIRRGTVIQQLENG